MINTHPDLCTGCRICEIVCSMTRYGNFNPRKAAITILLRFDGLVAQPTVCKQCTSPFCVQVCPFDALRKHEKTGAVVVDDEGCNGCGWCVKYCPEGAIKIDPTSKSVIKCDLCGGDPICVNYCPTNALEYLGGSKIK